MSPATAAPLVIAADGRSTYSIVVPAVAPHSVTDAARELQRSVEEATGARLSIVNDGAAGAGPYISLGSTRQAAAAGFSAEKMPDEGYRVATRGGSLFILGLDTTTIDLNRKTGAPAKMIQAELHPEIPGPAFTRNGELSFGTANGVYSFLEDKLGVRWLLPGDLGRDVPARERFVLEEMDQSAAPTFIYRQLILLGTSPAVSRWRDQARLGSSIRISFGEGQHEVVPQEMYREHPEWFAMDSTGKRPDPKGNIYYKLETTNPELVKFYARRVVERMKNDPLLQSVSLTPSDGLGFSQSPESKALYDPPMPGSALPVASVTPLVLKWYSDISEIVAKEHPAGKTAGFLYSNYIYPPQKGQKTLPPNFIPAFVGGQGGGFGYYRPEARKMEAYLLNEWGKIVPGMWFFYGFPTWLRNDTGMITPPSADNMNFLFSQLARNRMRGTFMYGSPSWSHAGITNYVLAKMMWNPAGDARAVQRDWLYRAYGAGAGAVMERLYDKMDESWFADHFRAPDTTFSNINETFFRRIYGEHYREMEALFLEADRQTMTPVQKKRLNLIRDNMRVLQWRLRNAGYLPAEYKSALTVTGTEQVFELLTAEPGDFGLFPGALNRTGLPVKATPVQVGKVAVEGASVEGVAVEGLANPNPNHIVLYPTRDGAVRLKPGNVAPGSSFLSYYVQNEKGRLMQRGLMATGNEITLPAKANTPLYFHVIASGVTLNPEVRWEVQVPGAVTASASLRQGVLYLERTPAVSAAAHAGAAGEPTLYVHVPATANVTGTSGPGGVTIGTLTSEQKEMRVLGKDKDRARAALADATRRHKGTVIQNLNFGWKFSPDTARSGGQQGFFKPEFRDADWKTVTAIGPWQRNGFADFQGTGWYRRPLTLKFSDTEPTFLGNNRIWLFFGAIDGDAVIYLNGQKIGEHKMADHANGWEVPVAFDVTEQVRVGVNQLAVQVTKDRYVGGLYRGAALIAGTRPQ